MCWLLLYRYQRHLERALRGALMEWDMCLSHRDVVNIKVIPGKYALLILDLKIPPSERKAIYDACGGTSIWVIGTSLSHTLSRTVF